MIRALVYASLFASFAVLAGPAANAEPRLDVPIELDFSPLGPSVAAEGSSAPADVSFGSYPLSILGIENAIRRADARVQAYARGAERVDVGPVAYSVVAIRDWERRYPRDPWIPKELLSLCRFYEHVGTSDALETASHAAAWLHHDYPQSPYAREIPLDRP